MERNASMFPQRSFWQEKTAVRQPFAAIGSQNSVRG